MSVPTHNLYDFVHRATKKRFLLKHFHPYSSRYLKDCIELVTDWDHGPNRVDTADRLDFQYNFLDTTSLQTLQPVLFCHDQEPLMYEYYADDMQHMTDFIHDKNHIVRAHIKAIGGNLNLRWINTMSVQKTWILLHSELNSKELDKYQASGAFLGAYWWSHAMLALDWYRFAQHDPALDMGNDYKKLFLIYCRDTTGSREYRKDFLNLIQQHALIDHSQIGSFSTYNITSDSSAVYDAIDHTQAAISVVLETVFDSRIHLTEKILRPLACGHPFLLAGGPGSLALLHTYGFKTFAPCINETYDTVQDHDQRLRMIVDEMKRIQNLNRLDLDCLIAECNKIAKFNKKHFFSNEFFTTITKELEQNVESAFVQHQSRLDLSTWWKFRQYRKKNKFTMSKQDPRYELIKLLARLCREQRQHRSNSHR
jgi:hypothetical protein